MFDAHSPAAVLLLSLFAGAIRVSTPYLFVSIGECLTEKGGRVNLGLEGILVSGAMTGYAAAYLSGSAWVGVYGGRMRRTAARLSARSRVLAAARVRHRLRHCLDARRHRAGFLSRQTVHRAASAAAAIDRPRCLGIVAATAQRAAYQSALHHRRDIGGRVAMGLASYALGHGAASRWRDAESARAMGYPITRVRILATAIGGFFAGVGGAYLSLCLSGELERRPLERTRAIAVALVIFARWQPLRCHGPR